MTYEALAAVAADFHALPKTLEAPDAASRVAAISAALEKTAAEIAEHPPADELEREAYARLFRGFNAASRVVTAVQERRKEGAQS